MPRREENYGRRRRKLLCAARDLFDHQGFEATTVQQIAKDSKMALRTVYNFFPAKIDILASLLADEATANLSSGLKTAGTQDGEPQERLIRVLKLLIHVFTGTSKHESRLVAAQAISAGRTTLAGRIYGEMDEQVQAVIFELLLELERREALGDGIEAGPLSRLVFNTVNGLFLLWLGEDEMTEAQCFDRMVEHVDLLLPKRSAQKLRTSSRVTSTENRKPLAARSRL